MLWVSQASVPLAVQAQMELSQAQNRRVAKRSELRSRAIERLDKLVRGMEAVAQRRQQHTAFSSCGLF